VCRNGQDLQAVVMRHLVDRANLKEFYDAEAGIDVDVSEYISPRELEFSAWPLRLDHHTAFGDKTSWLTNSMLVTHQGVSGDCVFEALIHQFQRRPKIHDTVQAIRDMCGLQGRVSLSQLSLIEERYVIRTPRGREGGHRVGFVVFDARFNLRRLPPPSPYEINYRKFCYVAFFNGHIYSFKNQRTAAMLKTRGLSYYQSLLELARYPNHYPEDGSLQDEAYQLFRSMQSRQPDTLSL
jgi:hypothetical protein